MPKRNLREVDFQDIIFPTKTLDEQAVRKFREVFLQWTVLARRYADRWEKKSQTWTEVHWWYRERAHVGLFTSAVWMAGGVALEEYGSEKTADPGDGPATYKGRTDLCFSLPLPNRNYVAETKHVTADLPTTAGEMPDLNPVRKALKRACKDALRHEGRDKRVGMVFVTLDSPGAIPNNSKTTEAIERWTRWVVSDSNCNTSWLKKCLFIGWLFPSEARLLTDGKTTGKPGTAIFVADADGF